MKIYNKTRSTFLMQHGKVANTVWSRFVGLMGKKSLAPGEGLVIIPNNSVHMFFMRFPLDIVFADKTHRIVYISHNLKPWRISKIIGKAHYVIELPANTARETGTEIGDLIEWSDN